MSLSFTSVWWGCCLDDSRLERSCHEARRGLRCACFGLFHIWEMFS